MELRINFQYGLACSSWALTPKPRFTGRSRWKWKVDINILGFASFAKARVHLLFLALSFHAVYIPSFWHGDFLHILFIFWVVGFPHTNLMQQFRSTEWIFPVSNAICI